MTKYLTRLAPVALMAWQLLAGAALAQQPTAGAIAAARELVLIKGGAQMFEPIINNMIDQTRGALLQTNPQLSKDLGDVGQQLRAEFGPRTQEVVTEAAKGYASRFSEAELKDLVAFFKSPLGQKMIAQEPQVLDDAVKFVQQVWGPRTAEEVMNRFRAEMKKKGHNL